MFDGLSLGQEYCHKCTRTTVIKYKKRERWGERRRVREHRTKAQTKAIRRYTTPPPCALWSTHTNTLTRTHTWVVICWCLQHDSCNCIFAAIAFVCAFVGCSRICIGLTKWSVTSVTHFSPRVHDLKISVIHSLVSQILIVIFFYIHFLQTQTTKISGVNEPLSFPMERTNLLFYGLVVVNIRTHFVFRYPDMFQSGKIHIVFLVGLLEQEEERENAQERVREILRRESNGEKGRASEREIFYPRLMPVTNAVFQSLLLYFAKVARKQYRHCALSDCPGKKPNNGWCTYSRNDRNQMHTFIFAKQAHTWTQPKTGNGVGRHTWRQHGQHGCREPFPRLS